MPTWKTVVCQLSGTCTCEELCDQTWHECLREVVESEAEEVRRVLEADGWFRWHYDPHSLCRRRTEATHRLQGFPDLTSFPFHHRGWLHCHYSKRAGPTTAHDQVWLLTQLYFVGYFTNKDQRKNGVFFINTQWRYASGVYEGVLGPPCLAFYTPDAVYVLLKFRKQHKRGGWRLKKPLKGSRPRQESCWKEPNRIMSFLMRDRSLICPSEKSMIFYLISRKQSETNELVTRPAHNFPSWICAFWVAWWTCGYCIVLAHSPFCHPISLKLSVMVALY